MSALKRIADSRRPSGHVRKVPKGDISLAFLTTKESAFAAAKAKAVDAAAIFQARVPELTASAGIKLNERHSLRRCKNRLR
jgi:hypothetical protein